MGIRRIIGRVFVGHACTRHFNYIKAKKAAATTMLRLARRLDEELTILVGVGSGAGVGLGFGSQESPLLHL